MRFETQAKRQKMRFEPETKRQKVAHNFDPCVKSELDLFELPKVQAVMDSGLWIESYPVSSLDNGNTIEFLVAPS